MRPCQKSSGSENGSGNRQPTSVFYLLPPEFSVSQFPVERVLVVPTALFHQLGHFQGFCGEVDRYFDTLLSPEHTSFRPRDEVEHDPSFKQLIPYLIFRHLDGGRQQVFQYTRGRGMGEGRLHSKRSVGIGGHISADDVAGTGGNAYQQGMRREMDEEVIVETPVDIRCVGLINDDQTPVGQVHLGVVHLVDCQRPAVRPREEDIIESGFRDVDEIMADLTGFETWSEICLRALFGGKQ
jgi:predicted NUDIX family phosphoesterase